MSDYNDGLVPEPCLRLSCGFGQQYASVELGDGTGYVRVTDDLRSEHHEMKRWYDDVLREALDENAKLRELCADMYRCSEPCNDCPHYNCSNSGFYCGLGIGWKARRMRELGIEVDG